MTRISQTEEPPTTASVVCAGALTLAVAMGIGRFAFTPLLPLMMRDGLIDATVGAELAAANYLGYLAGALSAARLAGQALRLVWASLLAIALLTAAAGLASGELAWSLLRFGAGLASAWAMVGISSWSLTELARRGQGGLGALMFGGVGGGIILAGIGWWARVIWESLQKLKEDLHELEVDLPKTYVNKNELDKRMQHIEDMFQRIYDKLDNKADKGHHQ